MDRRHLQRLGRGDVGEDHELLDQPVRVEALDELAADHPGRADDERLAHQSGSQRRHQGTSLRAPPGLR